MRFVRYLDGHTIRHGLVEQNAAGEEDVAELRGGLFDTPEPTGTKHSLAAIKLLPPIVPATFYAAGINYMAHRKTAAAASGKPLVLPTEQHIGYRANNALIAHGNNIVIPSDSSGKVQYEGELVVIIGKTAKHLTPENALSCVFGYTIGNDVSERVWQRADRTFWRGKNSDTFKPMGPWIATEADIANMVTVVRLNGKEVSRFHTADMVFGIAETISSITRYITLIPGDVIWMGTDDPTLDMVAGDEVEVELTGLGVLRNPVVAQR